MQSNFHEPLRLVRLTITCRFHLQHSVLLLFSFFYPRGTLYVQFGISGCSEIFRMDLTVASIEYFLINSTCFTEMTHRAATGSPGFYLNKKKPFPYTVETARTHSVLTVVIDFLAAPSNHLPPHTSENILSDFIVFYCAGGYKGYCG